MKDKISLLTLLVICLIGCTPSSNEEEIASESDYQVINKDSSTSLSAEPEPTQNYDSLHQLLVSNGILPKAYPINGILSQKSVRAGSYQLGIIKFVYDNTLEQDTIVPVQNVIYLQKNTELACYKLVASVDEDDFGYMFKKGNFWVFDYYSSPVGYSELYIYDSQNNKILKSEKLDEADHIDSTSFKVENMTFEVSNYADSIVTKKIHEISWDKCDL